MAKKATTKKSNDGPKYWLFKSEPSCYSIDDLKKDKKTFWDGIRNYQARNMLRDDIKPGDYVLYYHSNAKPMAVVGTAKVVKEGYPDHTQFDKNEGHYDPKADPDEPRWFMVDVKFIQKFPEPVTRDDLKADKITSDMMVMQRGSRLSVQPVEEKEWLAVHKLAGVKPK
jgi:predicted RNA-binding protein with PUA-like domain